MRVLDVDLDFFVDPINNWPTGRGRLPGDEYRVWPPDQVREFFEEQCGLSRERRIPGWVFRHHHEAFYYWRDLIREGTLSPPFDLVHVDAHSDMGTEGTGGHVYLLTELLGHPPDARHSPDRRYVGPGNYPLYALANRWVRAYTFVMPAAYRNDMLSVYWADPDNAYHGLQLRHYDDEHLSRAMRREYARATPRAEEPVVPLHLVRATDYRAEGPFDVATLCQSPHYTPAAADAILPIFREYVLP